MSSEAVLTDAGAGVAPTSVIVTESPNGVRTGSTNSDVGSRVTTAVPTRLSKIASLNRFWNWLHMSAIPLGATVDHNVFGSPSAAASSDFENHTPLSQIKT